MKKLFGLMLLCATMVLSLSSCSDDDEYIDNSEILGTWSETKIVEEDYLAVTMEIIWNFEKDNTAYQRVILSLNGYTFKDVTNNYSYIYDGKIITFTDTNNKSWDYEVYVTGNNMKLGNEEDGFFNLTKK